MSENQDGASNGGFLAYIKGKMLSGARVEEDGIGDFEKKSDNEKKDDEKNDEKKDDDDSYQSAI